MIERFPEATKKITTIHPTALVEKGAELGVGVQIGPYAVVGAQVRLDDEVEIGAHCVVSGRTQIGTRTKVWPFASLGSTPQDLKFRGEDAELIIGSENLIREYVNMSIGTEGGGGLTRVGNGNLFMVHTHVAHDCVIADNCIFANGVSLGGHIEVDSSAVFGGHAAVHQFVRIGKMAMLAGGAIVVQDVPPYCTVHGNHAAPHGLNLVGIRRSGMNSEELSAIKTCYKLLYHSNLTLAEAIAHIQQNVAALPCREVFLNFLSACIADGKKQRGICR
jgi:UDP-N-acetylglucosamine acyltransferase